MKDFELLKRTYPISKYDRYCDGYDFIIQNTTIEERKNWNIKRIIKAGEKYIYQVAKEGKNFKIMCICFENFAIIRNKIFKFEDD